MSSSMDGELTASRFCQSKFVQQTCRFAPDAEILAERREILQEEGQSENFKQIQKLCMPFLKFKKDEPISIGPQALKLRLPFGEIEVLQSNMDLIKRQEFEIYSASEVTLMMFQKLVHMLHC